MREQRIRDLYVFPPESLHNNRFSPTTLLVLALATDGHLYRYVDGACKQTGWLEISNGRTFDAIPPIAFDTIPSLDQSSALLLAVDSDIWSVECGDWTQAIENLADDPILAFRVVDSRPWLILTPSKVLLGLPPQLVYSGSYQQVDINIEIQPCPASAPSWRSCWKRSLRIHDDDRVEVFPVPELGDDDELNPIIREGVVYPPDQRSVAMPNMRGLPPGRIVDAAEARIVYVEWVDLYRIAAVEGHGIWVWHKSTYAYELAFAYIVTLSGGIIGCLIGAILALLTYWFLRRKTKVALT
jgi:hypothetical protein